MAPTTDGNLSSEDQSRMSRLTEEISSRYFEMTTIMERTLQSGGLRERAFALGSDITMSMRDGGSGEVCICVNVASGAGHYINPPGECASGPCPG